MFSYRHAFHAGSHADVLKHLVLVAILRHLTAKPAPLAVVDTHAGAGLYRLDDDYAATSGEARDGVLKLAQADRAQLAPAITDYLDIVASYNSRGALRLYPGSPFVTFRLLRSEARDRLKLFELHPTDLRLLAGHVAQLEAGRMVALARQDGFDALKALLPPPARRALVLIDPSYEIKSDYGKVATTIQDSLRRFPTGTYAVWYPVIPRLDAHELPRRLKTLANQARRPWTQATLSIGQPPAVPATATDAATRSGPRPGPGLSASGIFVINPPHTLKATLQQALPQLVSCLGRGRGQGYTVEGGG